MNANSDIFAMRNFSIYKGSAVLGLMLLLTVVFTVPVSAQLKEPEVDKIAEPKTPLSEGFHNSVGFDIFLNNFGFGLGGHYSRVLGPYTELTFRTAITGIRDVSEQTFQSFLTGQQIVPNKYKRAIGFPFILGVEQRLFARNIEDNFRFYVGGGAGPAMAFTFPYLNDVNNNGFRDFQARQGYLIPRERVNDFFSGWKDGETRWGLSGELKIGVELGSSFGSVTTVEFGYFFYYFKQGLQIMEPYRPTEYDADGFPVEATKVPFNDAQKYFGTPQIKFSFGGMW